MQARHRTHRSATHRGLFSSILIAAMGQLRAHRPQPMQVSSAWNFAVFLPCLYSDCMNKVFSLEPNPDE
jgi:hypothetical protein